MMLHLTILPIILPLLAATAMLLPPLNRSIERHRITAVLFSVAILAAATMLLVSSHLDGTQLYMLGDWKPPFGIVLVADRLSTLMVLLTSTLALGAQLYACDGDDKGGMYFHPLFMFQIMGINGAFLTGDLFNLFVFFEILLISSYGLLIHGGGKQKTKASVHYVVLNLVGSSIFLFALGILYGAIGTLNIADMALKVRELGETKLALAEAGGLMLLVVFGLKAALLPLHFWLPRTYSAAVAPIAALFAIMTKVGVYSIMRVHTVIFGAEAGPLADIAGPWLWPLAILTIGLGAIGVLASNNLRRTTANLIIVSVGTLLVAVAMQRPNATAAALYYMIHTTLVSGAFFLIAGLIVEERGKVEDNYVSARKLPRNRITGIAFVIAALTVIGMPPFSGFVGKIMVLQAAQGATEIAWVWPFLLVGGLFTLIALSRAGTSLFWRVSGESTEQNPPPYMKFIAIFLLLAASPLLVVFAGPVTEFTTMAANQLFDTRQSVDALLPGGSL